MIKCIDLAVGHSGYRSGQALGTQLLKVRTVGCVLQNLDFNPG